MSNPEAMAEDHNVAEPAIASVFDMLTQRLYNLEQAADFYRRNEVFRQSWTRGGLNPELFGIKADRVVKHFEDDSVSGVFVRCSLEGGGITNHIFDAFMKGGEHQDVLPQYTLDKLRKKFGQNASCRMQPWTELGTTNPADFPRIGDEVTFRIVRKQFPHVQLYVADEASARFYLSFTRHQPISAVCLAVEKLLQFVSMQREGLSLHLFKPLIVPPTLQDASAPVVDLACLTPALVSPRQMSRTYWDGMRDVIVQKYDVLSRLRLIDILRDILENPDLQGGFSAYNDIRAEFTWDGVSDVLAQLEASNVQ